MTTFQKNAGQNSIGIAFLAMIGCVPTNSEQTMEQPSLPVVSGSRLGAFVEESELPVLVEFGVDYQCERCFQMHRGIVALRERFEGRAEVVRVDFTSNTEMVAELGGTICPTYVFFKDGTPLRIESFPVSADLLETHLSSMVDKAPDR